MNSGFARHKGLKLALLVAAFAVPMLAALALIAAARSAAKLDTLDIAFCLLTLTNCQPQSPFSDAPVWPSLLRLNAAVFLFWLIYAGSAHLCLAARRTWLKVLALLLALSMPTGMVFVGFLAILLPQVRL
ncbi:hypothetical protein [Pseudomonas mangrovi]|jgi:hypothetical protein|uniref:Uncharacterized protein n=1 Tax=Pseudomonas mangrovi TaxID=2161748 RepID=A0A2T5PDH3_9PSED|nr:hypothetical protein [Pseudomonas mangrovi]PTU75770.1 hypothetical protein DBO85_03610 [Pseudomonas mangrovi]